MSVAMVFDDFPEELLDTLPDQPLPAGPVTRAELDAMPDDGRRHEIVDGMLYVSAAPGLIHQRVVLRLAIVLTSVCPPDCEVVVAPFDVALADDTVMEPDVLVARRCDLTSRDLPAAPVLAVEVLSYSTRLYDTHIKRERFERAGTPHFWVINPVANPDEAHLVAWTLGPDKRYEQVADVKGNDPFTTEDPFPVTVVPADLVRD